jgi:hypothetical protein
MKKIICCIRPDIDYIKLTHKNGIYKSPNILIYYDSERYQWNIEPIINKKKFICIIPNIILKKDTKIIGCKIHIDYLTHHSVNTKDRIYIYTSQFSYQVINIKYKPDKIDSNFYRVYIADIDSPVSSFSRAR